MTNPGQFAVSLQNNVWQAIFMVGLNLLYFEFALPFVTNGKISRVIAILASIVAHLLALTLGLYAWRVLGTLIIFIIRLGASGNGRGVVW